MRVIRIAICTLLLSSAVNSQQRALSLIPWPVEVKQQDGYYLVKNKITVSNSLPAHEWPALFKYFRDEMKKQFGLIATEVPKGKKGDIDFFMKRMPTSGKPAYTLTVSKEGIAINSNFAEPTFHAIQTLFQLMPVDPKAPKEIPYVEIFDHARFDYRGMHLDVSRHFRTVDFVKRYIDYLALHKFNTFHWHLTDDQGWRIEIKKYPKLTSVGGWRNGTIIGRYPGTGNDGIKYGGYYTQDEIKEVVKYATERFITVIPEIEMPGHSSAAIAAYPELSCFPNEPTIKYFPKQCKWYGDSTGKQVQQTWGVFDDVFCAGQEKTFSFLEDVLDEVLALFPSKYVHVGGDECPKENWKRCPNCQKRIKENNLKDEHGLQSYFIQRMEKYLNKNGKILIGWDEILEGGLAPNAVVMSWRGEKGGIDAAKQKHNVIMTPGNPVYFDHTQSENEDSVTIGGFNPIEKVYAYEPVPKELSTDEEKYVLGAQANMWAEYMKNTKKVEYMLFPRISALSEVLWSKKENRNWDDFQKRLLVQFKRYDQWKVNYSKAYFELKTIVKPTEDHTGVYWILSSNSPVGQISYTSNAPEARGLNYTGPVKITGSLTTRATLINRKTVLAAASQKFSFNKATGKKITLAKEASSNYPGDGAFSLVNGVINEKGFARTKEFLGFNGTDCEAVIDLGESLEISFVVVNLLNRTSSWIWRPQTAEVLGSGDGQTWYPLKMTDDFVDKKDGTGKGTMILPFRKTFVRYVKVIVTNWGVIPPGNPGAGNKAWLFVDEIEVN
ncbi:MAG TPA: family 20 glycosylhydrolase [Chitinophagaceae bacterium]|nr:family 20 glycosylhydrolase [Chitinophagaceae bacterium]